MEQITQGSDKYLKPSFWRRLLGLWTIVVFLVAIVDFIQDNAIDNAMVPILIIYTAILSAYSAEKEFRRWHDFHSGRHPGEIYVILWTILIITIFTADVLLNKPYSLPESITSTYIIVIGILAITKNSKRLFQEKHNDNSGN